MNKKPILITAISVLVVAAAFLFIRSKYLAKPEKKEVIVFLDQFNYSVKQGFTDTLLNYFDGKQNNKQLVKLLGILSNKTSINGKDKALFDVNLITDNSEIRIINAELTEARIPVEFKENGNNLKQTTLILKIRKITDGQFKIVQLDVRQFLTDFLVYENTVRNRYIPDEKIYNPLTLAAFKTADKLKTRYDSVVWFAHIDQKTFFYVVKGKWDMDENQYRHHDSAPQLYKMGLVNPDLQEIIPVQYDLIHTIGATFPNMVEVEKDNKKGFYDMNGKVVIPVNYDEIYPIDDDTNAAVLKNGDDYFYFGKDMTISEKVDLKIRDFFSKIKYINGSVDLYTKALALPVTTEYNSRESHAALYIAPSYLTSLNMIGKVIDFKNPLRNVQYEEVHTNYEIRYSAKDNIQADNWLTASFYSIRDYFLGGRSEFYDKKNVVFIDQKKNRILTREIFNYYGEFDEDLYSGKCNTSNIKLINDSLFELRSPAGFSAPLYDSTKTVTGGVYYHYFAVRCDKLIELPNKRNFGFTKYVKMDDSYLYGCYEIQLGNWKDKNIQTVDHITSEMLNYVKNEIYAGYRFRFKDKRWLSVFADAETQYDNNSPKSKPLNANIDDSLTVIDQYNINFINNKLKQIKQPQTLAAQ